MSALKNAVLGLDAQWYNYYSIEPRFPLSAEAQKFKRHQSINHSFSIDPPKFLLVLVLNVALLPFSDPDFQEL